MCSVRHSASCQRRSASYTQEKMWCSASLRHSRLLKSTWLSTHLLLKLPYYRTWSRSRKALQTHSSQGTINSFTNMKSYLVHDHRNIIFKFTFAAGQPHCSKIYTVGTLYKLSEMYTVGTGDDDDDDDHKPSKFSQVKPSPSTSSTEDNILEKIVSPLDTCIMYVYKKFPVKIALYRFKKYLKNWFCPSGVNYRFYNLYVGFIFYVSF
jgi:hypothetical protein